MINNLVYSGVIIPGVIFGGLFLVPWIERRLTGDTAEHHLLDRPRDRASAHGDRRRRHRVRHRAVPRWFTGRDRRHASTCSIGRVTTILQIAALVAPPIVGYVTYHLCQALRHASGPRAHRAGGAIARTPTAATTRRPSADEVLERRRETVES